MDGNIKHTAPLKLIYDVRMKEMDLHINPNDGFDLGLMTTDYPISWCPGVDPETLPEAHPEGEGRIYLKNEVTYHTMILSSKWQNRITGPLATLIYHKGKISLESC